MTAWFTYLLSFITKMGSSFGYENSHVLGGELVYEIFVRGSVYILRNVVRLLCIFFSFFYIYLMYTSLVTIWHTLYLSMDIYIYIYVDVCYSPIFSCVVSFLSLCTCFLLFVCNLLFMSHTKMSWWVLFKVFQKYRLSKSSCHELSFCKAFQEFVL